MYSIDPKYQHQLTEEYFDDTVLEDQWQDEVYQYARAVYDRNQCRSVLDFGCGSGYKLIKYFSDADTLGVDLAPTVNFLTHKYPGKKWRELPGLTVSVDIFIAADVIEHLLDPDQLISTIKRVRPQHIILSTPDRNLTVKNWGYPALGPPTNRHHVREWTFDEFRDYIGGHFHVQDHCITRWDQCTQMIYAQLKN